MPVCVVYAGLSCVSILIVKTPDDKIQLNFPYSYSDYFSGNFKNKKNFVDALIERFFSENNLNKTDFQFAFCWYPEIPNQSDTSVSSISLNQLIKETTDFSLCIFVNRYGIFTQDYGNMYASLNPDTSNDLAQDVVEEMNLASNSYVFPQIIPNNVFDVIDEDNNVRFINIEPKEKIIITGDRFFGRNTHESPILAFDLIKKPGVFDFRIDTKNMWIMLELISRMNEKMGEILSANTDFAGGTLVNSPGGAECLVSGEEGSDRLLVVKDNSIFVLPLNKGSRAKITVKGSVLNTTQKSIWGGELGLVIDTREKTNLASFKEIYTQKNLKMWEEAICSYQY